MATASARPMALSFTGRLAGGVVGGFVGGMVSGMLMQMAYGALWWVVGALLIMPAWLGMTEMIFAFNTDAWLSLMGHLIYGLLLGT